MNTTSTILRSWRRSTLSRAVIATLLTTGLLYFGGLSNPSAVRAATITGPIVGIGGKCLDNYGGVQANGNPIVLWSCNGTSAQRWTLPGDGTIRTGGNYCLAVKGAGTVSTTPVWLYACDGGPAQRWTVRPDSTIMNPNSGLCLADKGANTTDGNPIWVYTCDAGPAQRWRPPTSSVDPSGEAMPVGDLPGWRQVFTDDFRTPVTLGNFPAAVADRWDPKDYNGWPDTSHNGVYTPTKVVSINGGLMNLNLHTENGVHLVAAPEPIIPGATGTDNGMSYGRYAVRFRADPLPRYKLAWLLWPDSNVWDDGEIDFPEGNLDGRIGAFLHHRGDATSQEAHPTGATFTSWHTAVVEWTPQSVRFLLDGAVVGVDTNPAIIPNTPMHWVLQTETDTDRSKPPADTTAGNVQIDWVAVWRRA
jgi:hypothetical protein